MYIINDRLATHGFNGRARVSNIDMEEEDLETGIIEVNQEEFHIVDVRQLKDGDPNPLLLYSSLINKCQQLLDQDKRVVVCCEAGQSRSNAIALGLLMTHKFGNMPYEEAYDLIKNKVKIAFIDPYHLEAIRKIFGVIND